MSSYFWDTTLDGLIQCILEADVSRKKCQKNWGRLIRKIYEVAPSGLPNGSA
jgi:hypothetical protein